MIISTHDGLDEVDGPLDPKLIVLNYSGGKQSACLLWMILRGEIEVDREKLVVLNADPGMENTLTYKYNSMMQAECEDAGIYYEKAKGPNLLEGLLGLKASGRDRFDNPPYWTKDPETGKRGKLFQGCTREFKIRPMDRAIRRILQARFGLSTAQGFSRLGHNIVEKWIGFSYDEFPRIKEPEQKYIYFRYPLYDLKLPLEGVLEYYAERGLPVPPRSVCNACFANGIDTLREMYENRPEDWAQAVAVDRAVRDLSQIGVKHPTYVSHRLIPLEELAERNFDLGDGDDQDGHSCDSGYCFV